MALQRPRESSITLRLLPVIRIVTYSNMNPGRGSKMAFIALIIIQKSILLIDNTLNVCLIAKKEIPEVGKGL